MGRKHERKRQPTNEDGIREVDTSFVPAGDRAECYNWDSSLVEESDDGAGRRTLSLFPMADHLNNNSKMSKIWKALEATSRLHIPKQGTPTAIQAQAWPRLAPSLFDNEKEKSKTKRIITLSPTGSGMCLLLKMKLSL